MHAAQATVAHRFGPGQAVLLLRPALPALALPARPPLEVTVRALPDAGESRHLVTIDEGNTAGLKLWAHARELCLRAAADADTKTSSARPRTARRA